MLENCLALSVLIEIAFLSGNCSQIMSLVIPLSRELCSLFSPSDPSQSDFSHPTLSLSFSSVSSLVVFLFFSQLYNSSSFPQICRPFLLIFVLPLRMCASYLISRSSLSC